VEFGFLGPMKLTVRGVVVAPGNAKQRAVLAMLLLDLNRVVTTDSLIDRLWGERPPATAANVLQTYVSRLRRLIDAADADEGGPRIAGRTGGYVLQGEAEMLDATRFEALVRDSRDRRREGDLVGGLDALHRGLALWRGPALADVADWAFARAAARRLEDLRVQAAEEAVEAEMALGRHEEAIPSLEALIAAHPLREGPWGLLMVALDRAGRQSDALGTYRRLRGSLAEELGVEPSPPLRRLEQAILRHDASLDAVDATPAAQLHTGAGGRTPFVGRRTELAELRRGLARAVAGTGGLVLIGGEPGVGKSRLCEELAADAEFRGRFRVLVGHCFDSGRDVPYGPWVEVIESATRHVPPEELRRALGDDAAEFARLVPELHRMLPDVPPPVEVAAEQQRRFTFNSIRDYLSRVSRGRPRLIVVEDLHWADEPTLLLLEHLAERLASIPCLVVATYRDPPIDVSPQLATTLARLAGSRRRATLLTLSRHSAGEVEALLGALGGQAPPPALCAAVQGQTEGNVFFVEELFRHLAESGLLFDDAGRYRADVSPETADVPTTVALVTGQRLQRLSPAARHVLSIAAVAGRQVGFDVLEAACGMDGDDLTDALAEAERARVLVTRPAAGREEEYRFTHELTRQALMAGLPTAQRRRHHLRVADAIEQVHAGDLAARAGTIAQHLHEAGSAAEPGRLFGHLLVAGKRALEAAAFEDALRHLRRAEPLAGHGDPGGRAELYLDLGRAERGVGRWEEAVVPWRQAIEILQGLGRAESVGRVCAEAAYSLLWAGRFSEAHDLARHGLAALGERETADRARLQGMHGMIVAFTLDYHAGLADIDRAVTLAERLPDPAALGEVLLWKTMAHLVFMEMSAAAIAGQRAAGILRQAGQLWQLASTIGFVHECLVNLGRPAEARALNQELAPLAERLGNTGGLWHHLMVDGSLAFCAAGDPGILEAAGRREIELCSQAGLGWASWGLSWLAIAAFLRGDWDEAVDRAQQAQAAAPPTPMWGLEWATHFECRAYAGQRAAAIALLEAERHRLPRPGQPAGWGPWLMLLSVVEGLLALGERKAAAGWYPAVRYCIERTGVVTAYPNDCRLVQRVAGMAAAAGRDWAAAEAHFAAALAQAEELPHRPEQAHVRRFLAAMLLERNQRGDRSRATRLSIEAETLYTAMGMPRHAALTRSEAGAVPT